MVLIVFCCDHLLFFALSTTTETHICPGWKLLLVPVFQLGTPSRDKCAYAFCPGCYSTGINVVFHQQKKSARQLCIRELASPNPKGDQNCNLKIKIHHYTEITQTSHQEAQDPVHNTEIDLIHITQRFITSIIKNKKKVHRAHVVARLRLAASGCGGGSPGRTCARPGGPEAAHRPQPTPSRAAAAGLSPAACAWLRTRRQLAGLPSASSSQPARGPQPHLLAPRRTLVPAGPRPRLLATWSAAHARPRLLGAS